MSGYSQGLIRYCWANVSQITAHQLEVRRRVGKIGMSWRKKPGKVRILSADASISASFNSSGNTGRCRPVADRESHYEDEETTSKKRKVRSSAPPSKKKRRS